MKFRLEGMLNLLLRYESAPCWITRETASKASDLNHLLRCEFNCSNTEPCPIFGLGAGSKTTFLPSNKLEFFFKKLLSLGWIKTRKRLIDSK